MYSRGEVQEALRIWSEALTRYEQSGAELGQADSRCCIGAALGDLGRYNAAMLQQKKALELYEGFQGTARQQAGCLNNIGIALNGIGQHEDAFAYIKRALAIYEASENTERFQALCHNSLGATLRLMGEDEEAISQYRQALTCCTASGGTLRERAVFLHNIGSTMRALGKYEEAIANSEQAMTLIESIRGTEREQASCHLSIGLALADLHRYEQAICHYEQARVLLKSVPVDGNTLAWCNGAIGWTQLSMSQVHAAVSSFERARSNWWVRRGLARAYRTRAEVGDDRKAMWELLEAVECAEQKRASLSAFEHRVQIFEEPVQVFSDFVGLLVELAQKKTIVQEPEVVRWAEHPGSDRALLESAFHFADRGKGRGMEDALREKASLTGTDLNVRLLAEDRELSLQVSRLTSLREELPLAEVERKNRLTQQIDEAQQKRNMLEVELKKTALGGYVAPEFRKPMEMARELPAQTAVLQYSVGEKASWLLVLTSKGVTAHRVGVETPALPEVLPRREATLGQLTQGWQKQPDQVGLEGLVQLVRLRMDDLSKRPSERHNRIDSVQEQAILARLGAVVLPDSALSQLRQEMIHHMLVIPDGALHYVPFGMLRVQGGSGNAQKYLIEEYAISHVPAMATLDTIRKQAQERQQKRKMERYPLLAFANPSFREGIVSSSDDMVTRLRSVRGDYYGSSALRLTVLPETEQEAMRVASLFGPPERYTQTEVESPTAKAAVCTAEAASEDVVKRLLAPSEDRRQWQYLLFSTHGLADTRNGMLSCLALSSPSAESSEDGFLQAQEILGLKLDCDLVMLSACQTGLGRLRSGEGLVGLSGAFFYAGAESVCASLWQVPSGPTSQLTTEFFRNLKAGKLDKAEALRQAQLTVLRSTERSPDGSVRYSDPFCWAAFVLTGEWK